MTIEKCEVNNNVTNDVTNNARETGFLIEHYRKWCQENNCQVRALLMLLERQTNRDPHWDVFMLDLDRNTSITGNRIIRFCNQ